MNLILFIFFISEKTWTKKGKCEKFSFEEERQKNYTASSKLQITKCDAWWFFINEVRQYDYLFTIIICYDYLLCEYRFQNSI